MHSDDAIPSMPHIRAAQYVRMSTEHQQYSTENQADVIREYAAARGYEIVKTRGPAEVVDGVAVGQFDLEEDSTVAVKIAPSSRAGIWDRLRSGA